MLSVNIRATRNEYSVELVVQWEANGRAGAYICIEQISS